MTINKLMFAYVIIIMIALSMTINASASELQDGKTTFYLPTGNLTYTETVPKEGLTVASDIKYMGMTVAIYYEDGEELVFVGYFECQDKGGKVNRNHFDIFVESLDTEYDPFRFLIEDRNRDNRKIKFVLIDAEG
jgi:3D (Asp-Asp-Asp) domain-containing protein